MVLSTSSNNDSPVPKRWPLVGVNTGIVCIMLTTRKQKQSIFHSHRDQELRSCMKQRGARCMLFKLKPHSANFTEQGPYWVRQLVLTAEMPLVTQQGRTPQAAPSFAVTRCSQQTPFCIHHLPPQAVYIKIPLQQTHQPSTAPRVLQQREKQTV